MTENKRQLIDSVLDQRTRHFTVMLEDLYHPHNVSAVIRTCDCFGVQDLYVAQKLHDYRVNPNVVRGAAKWVNIEKFTETENAVEDCLNELKKKGYRLVGTTPDTNSTSMDQLDISEKTAFLFGTEKDGLSEATKAQVDELVHIPMYGFTESFNISVSAALLLQQLVKRLKDSDLAWQLTEEERSGLKFDWYQRIVKNAEMHIDRFEKERGGAS